MTYNFNAAEQKGKVVEWIRDWFHQNGPTCNAVIGISGGKDSSIAAALCVEALGKERVIGVLMPNGVQHDIADSAKVCETLGIRNITIDISNAVTSITDSIDALFVPERDGFESIDITAQTRQNLPPRIRMATLYAVSQSVNGRVVNTCNLSESMIGWETRWGDAVGDFAPLADLTASEVIQIGLLCDLPTELVLKKPSDGLCGKTDEDAFGFSYGTLDTLLRTGKAKNKKAIPRVESMIRNSAFKRKPISKYASGIGYFWRFGRRDD